MNAHLRIGTTVLFSVAVTAAYVGSVPLACADDVEAHRLIIRTAPDVTLQVDADGNPWFLPEVLHLDHSVLGDSERIRSVFERKELVRLHSVFPNNVRQNPLARTHRLDRYYIAEFSNQNSMLQTYDKLQILIAQDSILELAEIDARGGVASVPNDPDFNLQYGLRNTGQNIFGQSGLPGSDISVVDAWSQTIGSPTVTVAVLDSGVNTHEEFADRMVPGWNVPQENTDVTDQCASHGTHVAGTVSYTHLTLPTILRV